MADTTALKNRIRAAIKANDNQEITGPILQQSLLDIVDELNEATETEATQRQSGDNILQQRINTETQRAQQAENGLSQATAVLQDNMFSNFGSTVNDTQIVLTIDLNGGRAVYVILKAVTSTKAGLMTPAMLAALDGALSDILQLTQQESELRKGIKSISVQYGNTNEIVLETEKLNGNEGTVSIPSATSQAAGVMSAEQAALLEDLNDRMDALDFSTAGITEGGTTQEAINTELRKGVKDIQPLYGDSDNIVLEAERINAGTFTVTVPSATPQAAGAMSAEQAALLADLSNRVDALEAGKATLSLAASPSSMWYGETQDIVLSAVASTIASSITIKKGNTILNTGSNVSSLGYTDDDINTSQSYSAQAVIKGVTKTASASVTVIYPKYIGAGMVYGDVVTLANRVSTVTGRHTVEITQSGQRIFIVTDVTINKVISDNFEVPMTRTTTTMNGKTYYIYQSDTLVPYTFNLVIS